MKLTTKLKLNKVLDVADTLYQQKKPDTFIMLNMVSGIENVQEGGHSPPISPLFIKNINGKKRVE